MARLLVDSHAALADSLEAQGCQQELQHLDVQRRRENDTVSARVEGWTLGTCLREAGGHRPGMIQEQRRTASGRGVDGEPLRK